MILTSIKNKCFSNSSSNPIKFYKKKINGHLLETIQHLRIISLFRIKFIPNSFVRLYFNKILRQFIGTLKFGKHCSKAGIFCLLTYRHTHHPFCYLKIFLYRKSSFCCFFLQVQRKSLPPLFQS